MEGIQNTKSITTIDLITGEVKNIDKKKKYKIIYADPPWQFETWSEKGKGRGPEQHYETMSIVAIKKLPIKEIADKDCALFLWATSPMLPQAIEVMKTWCFKYKTVAFTWVKKGNTGQLFKGLGFWTRLNQEYCLLGTRGKPKRVSSDVDQVIISNIKEHSRKPDEVRERIIKLMGDVSRIELFARHRFEGWDVWGLEAPKQIQKLLGE